MWPRFQSWRLAYGDPPALADKEVPSTVPNHGQVVLAQPTADAIAKWFVDYENWFLSSQTTTYKCVRTAQSISNRQEPQHHTTIHDPSTCLPGCGSPLTSNMPHRTRVDQPTTTPSSTTNMARMLSVSMADCTADCTLHPKRRWP